MPDALLPGALRHALPPTARQTHMSLGLRFSQVGLLSAAGTKTSGNSGGREAKEISGGYEGEVPAREEAAAYGKYLLFAIYINSEISDK